MREFVLPGDIPTLIRVLPAAFQYPENDEWNMQTDEVTSMVDSLRALRVMWPLFFLIRLVYPPARDIMRGYVWEEDGQAVGMVNIVRMGASDTWLIGNVAVLPDYRRRGIARRLVQAAIDMAWQRDADSIILDVLAGNLPARRLYESMGFTHFATGRQMDYQLPKPSRATYVLPEVPLPSGYRMDAISPANWRVRYNLACRITPAVVQNYEPVRTSRYRQPFFVRPLIPLFALLSGAKGQPFAVRMVGGQVVGTLHYSSRTRSGGVNNLSVALDPDHSELAEVLLRNGLRELWLRSPDRRVEILIPTWQTALCEAADAIEFHLISEYNRMGLVREDRTYTKAPEEQA
jgi:ribosomal protein S18 acetylase RimI-like enzyme